MNFTVNRRLWCLCERVIDYQISCIKIDERRVKYPRYFAYPTPLWKEFIFILRSYACQGYNVLVLEGKRASQGKKSVNRKTYQMTGLSDLLSIKKDRAKKRIGCTSEILDLLCSLRVVAPVE
ncbi:hypothetical protein NPIL_580781 [Nephila pilipes]|uniref:Uncharacterized protein n=1 Tax=Nephila pilipes TaxID=299642 RepID=A0A8X6QN58_NEPPI|nr:hypothetical protein NPIL_580781 [Nephila pilipes]